MTSMSGWDQIVGHEWAIELLQNAIVNQRVGHAYLLTGPDQIGKTTLALTFAQALNCTHLDQGQRPCGQCRSCQLISANRHPDITLVTPEVSERGRLSIKIDTIRELQAALSLASYEARFKVAILKRFDTATNGAANAFLKTLEEPPGDVILLLTALDAEGMLPTISSRCRTIALRPMALPLIEGALQTRWAVDSQQSNLLAHLADGRLGWAVDRVTQADSLVERSAALDQLALVLDGDLVDRFALADSLSRQAEALPGLLQTWITWWRDVLLLAWQGESQNGSAQNGVTNVDRIEQLAQVAGRWPRANLLDCLKLTREALWQLERNANTRLVMENLFLAYPG